MKLLAPAACAALLLCARGGGPATTDARTNALLNAAYGGTRGEVAILLAAGVDANARDGEGVSALSLAVAQGHTDVAATLLAHGADVNKQFTPSARAGHLGVTPLMAAAARGDVRTVALLLSHGADASAEAGNLALYNAGATALYLAEVRGCGDAATALHEGVAMPKPLWKFIVLALWAGAALFLRTRVR